MLGPVFEVTGRWFADSVYQWMASLELARTPNPFA